MLVVSLTLPEEKFSSMKIFLGENLRGGIFHKGELSGSFGAGEEFRYGYYLSGARIFISLFYNVLCDWKMRSTKTVYLLQFN